jgi:uncharacterized membrane protein
MSTPDTELLRIADELRDLAGRLAGAVDALSTYTTTKRLLPEPPPPVQPALPSVQPLPPPVQSSPPPIQSSPTPSWLAPVPQPVQQTPAQPAPVPGWSLFGDEVEEREPWTWDRYGGRVLAWVGGAVTVLGVVLLLILAIQRGWLGPTPRLLCGALLAFVLLGFGIRVHRSPHGHAGAFALAATGFTALYLDAVAATVLYHDLTTITGLLAALVVAGAGLFLADRWESPSLAVFVLLAAAACAPLVTQAVTPLLVAFLLVLASTAIPVQLRRNWPYLAVAAEGPPLVFGLALARSAYLHGIDVPATVTVAFVTTALCVALAIAVVERAGEHDPFAMGLLFVSPVPVMAAVPLLPKWPAVVSLAVVSALLSGIWATNRLAHRWPSPFAVGAGAAGAVTLGQATLLATSANTATLAITALCQAVLFAITARQIASTGILLVAAVYGAGGLIAALIGPVRLTLLFVTPATPVASSALVSAMAASVLVLVTAAVVGWAMHRIPALSTPGRWTAIGIVALYGFSGAVLCGVMLVSSGAAGFRVGHLVITVGWVGCALALLAKGIRSMPARVTGLVLIGAAVLKLFTFDLVQLDGIARAGAFLCTGILLLVAGVRYAKLVAANRQERELRSDP